MLTTLIPLPNFWDTAKAMTTKTLRNQAANAREVHYSLYEGGNHPVLQLWHGYGEALCVYGLYLCSELRWREVKAPHSDYFEQQRLHTVTKRPVTKRMVQYPPWFGLGALHASHRQALIWQNPEYLETFPEEEEPMIRPELFWPECDHG